MNRDDPQFESDCYERLASARRMLMRAMETSGYGTAFQAASRLLGLRVIQLAEVLNGLDTMHPVKPE